MLRLAGKLALITGGSSGIGFATAKAFTKEGAHVAITGRNRETLEAARLALGSDTLAVQSDASDLAAIDALFAAIKERFGALDLLFANAGMAGGHAVEETTEAEFDRIFAVNVKGVFFTVQKALPLMRRGGSIVLNSSIGYRTGRPYLSLYAASKAAVRTFARNFSTEFAARGVRVNVVSPGAIDTPIWDHWREPAVAEVLKRQVEAGIPIGRMGTAEEVAMAVVFLASDESAFMLGAEITIDGGVTELPGAASIRN